MFKPITLSRVLAASITSCMASGTLHERLEAMGASSNARLWTHCTGLSSNVLAVWSALYRTIPLLGV